MSSDADANSREGAIVAVTFCAVVAAVYGAVIWGIFALVRSMVV